MTSKGKPAWTNIKQTKKCNPAQKKHVKDNGTLSKSLPSYHGELAETSAEPSKNGVDNEMKDGVHKEPLLRTVSFQGHEPKRTTSLDMLSDRDVIDKEPLLRTIGFQGHEPKRTTGILNPDTACISNENVHDDLRTTSASTPEKELDDDLRTEGISSPIECEGKDDAKSTSSKSDCGSSSSDSKPPLTRHQKLMLLSLSLTSILDNAAFSILLPFFPLEVSY